MHWKSPHYFNIDFTSLHIIGHEDFDTHFTRSYPPPVQTSRASRTTALQIVGNDLSAKGMSLILTRHRRCHFESAMRRPHHRNTYALTRPTESERVAVVTEFHLSLLRFD